ncbi:MAG: hypothetical protein DCC67_00575 [Planctomycetota bacterium]|nr:MAG: hypothetical protein DCC67_00575 [Planctomycetota bacterium]
MNDDYPHPAAPARPPNEVMRRNIRHLSADVITLAGLQAELLKVDLRDWSKAIVRAAIAAVAAVVLLLASLPALIIGLGYLLSETTDLGRGASVLIVAGCFIAAAAVCGGLAVWSLKRDRGMLQPFREELRRNVQWLKDVLSDPAAAEASATISR